MFYPQANLFNQTQPFNAQFGLNPFNPQLPAQQLAAPQMPAQQYGQHFAQQPHHLLLQQLAHYHYLVAHQLAQLAAQQSGHGVGMGNGGQFIPGQFIPGQQGGPLSGSGMH